MRNINSIIAFKEREREIEIFTESKIEIQSKYNTNTQSGPFLMTTNGKKILWFKTKNLKLL